MNLKQLRKQIGLTQEQAGEKMGGMTKQRFGQLEKAWPNVDASTIIKIMKTFHVSLKMRDDDLVFYHHKPDIRSQE